MNLLRTKSGFSLVQILMGMVITAILATLSFTFFKVQNAQYGTQMMNTELREQVRAAIDLIAREVRLAGFDPTASGLTGVEYSASQLEIKADLNADGDVDDVNETIIYIFDNNNKTISRSTGGNTATILEHVQSFQVTYRDASGTQIVNEADEDQIRQIDVSITGQTPRPDAAYQTNNGYRTLELATKVVPRNLAL